MFSIKISQIIYISGDGVIGYYLALAWINKHGLSFDISCIKEIVF